MTDRMDMVTFRRFVYYKVPDNALVAIGYIDWDKKKLIDCLEYFVSDCTIEFEWDELDGYLNVLGICCQDSLNVKKNLISEIEERLMLVAMLKEIDGKAG